LRHRSVRNFDAQCHNKQFIVCSDLVVNEMNYLLNGHGFISARDVVAWSMV